MCLIGKDSFAESCLFFPACVAIAVNTNTHILILIYFYSVSLFPVAYLLGNIFVPRMKVK